MRLLILQIVDSGLLVLHTLLILFNCIGWAIPKARKLHLASLGATVASWLLLGMWFGAGYCVLTDLQWRVRSAMDAPMRQDSFVQWFILRVTGYVPDSHTTSLAAGLVLGAATVLSVALNLRDWRTKLRRA